ncbi:uncharacterized protein [Spinacia oleracea]|uniref:Uncharacterized protein n=1 Tax=Spinacia oleracea TaxID=3562 RepID=A0ABM3QHP7_SPIOL|nr:uncharacterized protein LOC130459501 [Spinacia oleracea]
MALCSCDRESKLHVKNPFILHFHVKSSVNFAKQYKLSNPNNACIYFTSAFTIQNWYFKNLAMDSGGFSRQITGSSSTNTPSDAQISATATGNSSNQTTTVNVLDFSHGERELVIPASSSGNRQINPTTSIRVRDTVPNQAEEPSGERELVIPASSSGNRQINPTTSVRNRDTLPNEAREPRISYFGPNKKLDKIYADWIGEMRKN